MINESHNFPHLKQVIEKKIDFLYAKEVWSPLEEKQREELRDLRYANERLIREMYVKKA